MAYVVTWKQMHHTNLLWPDFTQEVLWSSSYPPETSQGPSSLLSAKQGGFRHKPFKCLLVCTTENFMHFFAKKRNLIYM